MGMYPVCLMLTVVLATNAQGLNKLDFYSSTLRNKPLLEVHSQLLRIIHSYSEAVTKVSTALNRFLSEAEIRSVSGPWPTDGDPLRSYMLIRRMSWDLENILALIQKSRSLDPTVEIQNLRQMNSIPNQEDLVALGKGLLRIQRVYGMTSHELAQGKLADNVHVPVRLSASDCLLLGELSEQLTSTTEDSIFAKAWYELGLSISGETTSKSHVSGVLQHRLESLKQKTGHQLEDSNKTLSDGEKAAIVTVSESYFSSSEINDNYVRLCRGEKMRAASMDKNNYCHFRRGPHPYMKLRPLKMEVMNQDPYLVVMHDIIGNSEIAKIQREAFNTIGKSNQVSGESSTINDYRVSATAWLPAETLTELSERLGAFVKMNANFSRFDVERFQVLNYGVGGHYGPHTDFLSGSKADQFYVYGGDRIATLMIYLSDVEVGGGTAFPYLGVTLWPKKGSAGFWWNLKNTGEGDFRTNHAACPVIYGNKWVNNKWFRDRSQMFKVPCSQRRNESLKPL